MCNNSVPSGALVVDDVPSSVPAMTDGCSKSGWSNSGSFSFSPFDADTQNHYEAKGDLHQIGEPSATTTGTPTPATAHTAST